MDPEKQPDVEVIDEEKEQPDAPSSVTVDLDKPEEPVAKKPEAPKKEEPKVDRYYEKRLHDAAAYQVRQQMKSLRDELKAEIRSLKDEKAAPSQINAAEQRLEDMDQEINAIAEKNWQKGVTKLVDKHVEKKIEDTVKSILQAQAEEQAKVQKRINIESELDKSKTKVLELYPEIEQEGTEANKLYIQAINEDPDVLSNPRGPWIAMKRMEELMEGTGVAPRSMKRILDKEVTRLARAGASNVVGKTSSPNGNGKITLTREQKEFCDHYKIPYDRFAKNLKATEAGGGVEL